MVIIKYEFLIDRLEIVLKKDIPAQIENCKKKALCVVGSEVGKAIPFMQTVFNAHTDKFEIEFGITDVKLNNKTKREIKKLLKESITDVEAISKIEILLSTL